MRLNLLVIRTGNIEALKTQYEMLGFKFEFHKHGNGPLHYAAEQADFVFEIYPLTKSMKEANNSIRLGFEIENLATKIHELESSKWNIISHPTQTNWGVTAVVQDLDGRKVELKNK